MPGMQSGGAGTRSTTEEGRVRIALFFGGAVIGAEIALHLLRLA